MRIKLPKFNQDLILKCQLIFLVGILVFLVGLLGFYGYKLLKNSGRTMVIKYEQPTVKTEEIFRRVIDGWPTAKGKENFLPVAVVIDNNPEAWPLFGLNHASVVYELPVEGVTTRFLALYTPGDGEAVDKIGPVRSARPYFVTLAKEYEAMLAHSGGSVEALELIEKLKVKNLEEIAWWGPDYFSRVYSRSSPHNLFTSAAKLGQAIVDWNFQNEEVIYRPWLFNDEKQITNLSVARNIEIFFSAGKIPDASYEYNASTSEYLRAQFTKPQIDGLGNEQVAVKNLIIQYLPAEKVLDKALRLELNLIGEGQAIIIMNGQQTLGSWKKMDETARTIFYDAAGKEIEFLPGNIWVEIVPKTRKVEIK